MEEATKNSLTELLQSFLREQVMETLFVVWTLSMLCWVPLSPDPQFILSGTREKQWLWWVTRGNVNEKYSLAKKNKKGKTVGNWRFILCIIIVCDYPVVSQLELYFLVLFHILLVLFPPGPRWTEIFKGLTFLTSFSLSASFSSDLLPLCAIL